MRNIFIIELLPILRYFLRQSVCLRSKYSTTQGLLRLTERLDDQCTIQCVYLICSDLTGSSVIFNAKKDTTKRESEFALSNRPISISF